MATKEKLLCVGGSRNGETVDAYPTQNVVEMSRQMTTADAMAEYDSAMSGPMATVPLRRETYVRESMSFDDTRETIDFMRHESLTAAEAFTFLLKQNAERR